MGLQYFDYYSETSDKGPSHERTTSEQRTLSLAQNSIIVVLSNLPQEDNPPIKDKSFGPKVSFIWRYCKREIMELKCGFRITKSTYLAGLD